MTELIVSYIVLIFFILIIFISLIGNILVVLSVYSFHPLRSQLCFHILASLAIADICVSLMVMPFAVIYYWLQEWPLSLNDIVCRIWMSLDVTCCTASILHLCLVAFDRYLAIARPLAYPNLVTPRRIKIGIVVVWLTSIMLSFLPIMNKWYDEQSKIQNDTSNKCELTPNKIYAVISSATSFYIPGVMMICLYVKIFQIALTQAEQIKRRHYPRSTEHIRQKLTSIEINNHSTINEQIIDCDLSATLEKSKNLSTSIDTGRLLRCFQRKRESINSVKKSQHVILKRSSSSIPRISLKHEAKAIKTVGLLLGCFLACWLPFFLVYLINPFCGKCISEKIVVITTWIGYGNSAVNPLLYCFLQREFRAAFKKLTKRALDPFYRNSVNRYTNTNTEYYISDHSQTNNSVAIYAESDNKNLNLLPIFRRRKKQQHIKNGVHSSSNGTQ